MEREGPRRGGQPGQVRVPRQYEPRAAHAAQRHHRVLRDDGSSMFGPLGDDEVSRICRDIRESGSICSTSSTTSSTCRRSRPAASALEPELIELDRFLAGTMRLVAARAAEQRSTSIAEIEPAIRLRADRRTFKQIVHQSVVNAVKFTPDGGRITVRGARCRRPRQHRGRGYRHRHPKDALASSASRSSRWRAS